MPAQEESNDRVAAIDRTEPGDEKPLPVARIPAHWTRALVQHDASQEIQRSEILEACRQTSTGLHDGAGNQPQRQNGLHPTSKV